MVENLHTLVGTLYAKDCRHVENKKKPTEPGWDFKSIKLETKVTINGRTKTEIPELQIDMNCQGIAFDDLSVGDHIEVDLYMIGKKISPTWYKTEAKVVYIKFSDITTTQPPQGKNNKVLTGAMSKTSELEELDKTFIPPSAKRPTDNTPVDDEFGDLPF